MILDELHFTYAGHRFHCRIDGAIEAGASADGGGRNTPLTWLIQIDGGRRHATDIPARDVDGDRETRDAVIAWYRAAHGGDGEREPGR